MLKQTLKRRSPIAIKISPDVAICLNHWKEHRPKMYREMLQAGTLEQEAMDAVEQTNKEITQLMDRGMSAYQADETTREQYVMLPEKEGNSPEAPASDGYKIAR